MTRNAPNGQTDLRILHTLHREQDRFSRCVNVGSSDRVPYSGIGRNLPESVRRMYFGVPGSLLAQEPIKIESRYTQPWATELMDLLMDYYLDSLT